MEKEKKLEKPLSIKVRPSTKEVLDKISQTEDRSLSYIIERSVRRDLKLDK